MIRDVLRALRIHDVKNVNNKLYCMSEASELDRANIWKAIQAHRRSHYISKTRKIANEPVEWSWMSWPKYVWHQKDTQFASFYWFNISSFFSKHQFSKFGKETCVPQGYLRSHRAENTIYVCKSWLSASQLHIKQVAIHTKNPTKKPFDWHKSVKLGCLCHKTKALGHASMLRSP